MKACGRVGEAAVFGAGCWAEDARAMKACGWPAVRYWTRVFAMDVDRQYMWKLIR